MTLDFAYYQSNRSDVLKFLPDSYSRVLEIGCGAGEFQKYLRKDCEVWGIEPNADAASLAAQKMHQVFSGTYDDWIDSLPDSYFDLVICNDVIEHMDSHDRFFESIKPKILKNAKIIGSIPNVRHITNLYKLLILKDWKYKDSGILDNTHLRFFTEKSLRSCFSSHGFVIDRLEGINSIIVKGIVGFEKGSLVKNYGFRAISLLVVMASLGYYWDTQFPQYGFAITYPE